MTYTYTWTYPDYIYTVQECDFETEVEPVAFFDFALAKQYAFDLTKKDARPDSSFEWKAEFDKESHPENVGAWQVLHSYMSGGTEVSTLREGKYLGYRVMKFPVLREVPVVQ